MIPLTIDFQAGFSSDTGVITINGNEVVRAGGLTTDYSIGLAKSFTLQVPAGEVIIEIMVPSRHLSDTMKLTIDKPVYLAVQQSDGALAHKVSDEPFVYF